MATATSLMLIAVGLILAIAVDYQVAGVDLRAIGVILFIVGVIGMVYSLLFLASFAPFGDRDHGGHTTGHGHGHV